MKSAYYFRDLCDEDLLLAGKDFVYPTYPPSYTEALIERFEGLLHDISVLVTERDHLAAKVAELSHQPEDI
jgi:hypothetical protein